MEEEDEFGDLYADVGLENSSFNNAPNLAPLRSQGVYEELDDEEVLYGRASPPRSQQRAEEPQEAGAEAAGEFEKQCDGNEVSRGEMNLLEDNARDCPETLPREGLAEESETEKPRVRAGSVEENEQARSGDQLGETAVEEKSGGDLCTIPAETDENEFQFEGQAGSPQADDIPGIGAAPAGMASIPGLSTRLSDFEKVDEDGEANGENWFPECSGTQDLKSAPELAGGMNRGFHEEEWDSDSEDDLQIVLNDDYHIYSNLERGDREFEEGSDDDDDDGEDLVIVAGGDHPIESQEWGPDAQLPLEGAIPASGDKASLADKPGDDRGQAGKSNAGAANSVIPRVGYSSQHFHPHYSHYKYVRPGAVPVAGGVPNSSGGVPNQTRPPLSTGGIWGAGKSVSAAGRGDWISSGGRGSVQRTSHSGVGMPPWSSGPMGRTFQNGSEFTLPPNKTVFEVDIDAFEEKPWRHPGVDITDFFNFSLDEDSWKQYCRQLEQLRLEATMQSKIHVYESGRPEQEYDPDLPPELAAATGLHEAFGESTQNRLPGPGPSALPGRGRGLGRGRPQIPTGRAIQVEGGVGERRPSVDFRRPRSHDSDAVIEIVLQDASEDDTTDPLKAPESANDPNGREESERGVVDVACEQKQLSLDYSLQARNEESWERDTGSKKMNSGGGVLPRSIHHGDGLLPLPPGPPIQCQSSSIAGPGMYSARLELQHFGRRSQLIKPYRGFSQVGDEHINGTIANQDTRGNRYDSFRKERGNGMERKQSPDIACTADDTERKLTSEVRGMIGVEQHPLDEIHVDLRSGECNRPAAELKVEDDAGDDHGSCHSIKRQKLSSQNESQTTEAGHSHHLKASKSGNSKAESGNSRDYSKGRGHSKDYSKGRGSCEEEISQYRPQKRLATDGKKPQCEEETYLYQKNNYLWNGRQVDEKGIRLQKGKENLKHYRDDPYQYGDWEEMYNRKAKGEITDKHSERDDHAKAWEGKNEGVQILREREEVSWGRDPLVKDDSLQHRNKRHDTDRYERGEHLHLKKKKDDDDWRARIDRGDVKRREREKRPTAQQGKEDDPSFRRKKDDDLLQKERVDKHESMLNVRDRDGFGKEKHEDEDDYRRRKEEELHGRDRPVKDQSIQDPRDREDTGREKHERGDDLLRRKEEDLRRRERLDKDQGIIRDPREREDAGKEKHERDGDYSRRKDEELRRRERSDKDQGIHDLRERENMGREKHERDDDYLRRKEEDWHRRERAEKDDSVRDLRDREDATKERHERNDDRYFRRKEEEARRRSLFDDSRARKQRDDSWRRRERDDEHWRKQGFEETHGRRDREEEKSILTGRSRRHSEEKTWHSSDRDKVRGREDVIDKDRLKDRRRHDEQRGKVKDQVDDSGRSRHHERSDIYSRMDRLSYEERSSRHDRAHLRYDHGHSGEEQKSYREKRTLDPAKGKSFDRNGAVAGLADDKVRHDQPATGRRRTEDSYSMHPNKKVLGRGAADEVSGSIWGGLSDRKTQSHTMPSDLPKRQHGQEAADQCVLKAERVAADESASEDEPVKRGRSKLERWTSQKEKDDANMWEKDAIKQQKQSANQEEEGESITRQDEQINTDWSGLAETNSNVEKDQPHDKEAEKNTADQEEKEAGLDEAVHGTDSKDADIDQGGNHQHCEIEAKLEKRRERFKLPIANEKDLHKKVESETFLENEADEVKQERPTRKRRWGSS